MMLTGVDPHKSTHTATGVEPGTAEAASIRIEATLGEPGSRQRSVSIDGC